MHPSELILNHDGSIYHLHLHPEDLAPTVFLVGDPERVPRISRHFDHIEVRKQKREFITHTGRIGRQRFTVISTGIGTDNIDIVVNELDALVNIDLQNRLPKENLTTLNLVRVGTSGSINPNVHHGQVVVSGIGIGIDALGLFYEAEKFVHPLFPEWAYRANRYPFPIKHLADSWVEGVTVTCPGFYGPQRRTLRVPSAYSIPMDGLHVCEVDGIPFTNLEMETSAIYLLAEKLGHRAISFNAILANRMLGEFTDDPHEDVDKLIEAVIDIDAWM